MVSKDWYYFVSFLAFEDVRQIESGATHQGIPFFGSAVPWLIPSEGVLSAHH